MIVPSRRALIGGLSAALLSGGAVRAQHCGFSPQVCDVLFSNKKRLASAPVITTTWNPADVHPGIVLSNGNLTAAGDTGAGRAVFSKSTGKFYYEATFPTVAGGSPCVGLANVSQSLSASDLISGNNCASFRLGDSVSGNDGFGSGYMGGGEGAIVGIAIDIDAKKIWATLNGTSWNGDSSNPATGSGGVSFSNTSAPIYPAFALNNAGNFITANFGATSFSYTKPSGFNNW